MKILWSILICSIPNRYGFDGDPPYAVELLKELHRQTEEYPDVEVLLLYDNQKRTTGAKRNALLNLAKGSHISFIDDDDMIAPDYVETLRSVIISQNPDVLVFEIEHNRYEDHKEVPTWHSIRRVPDPALGQYPYHTDVWRTSIARSVPFPDKNFTEDQEWMKAVFPKVSWCCLVKKTLYYWNWRNWIDQSQYVIPE